MTSRRRDDGRRSTPNRSPWHTMDAIAISCSCL
jgi:hypothetical protein